MGYGQMIRKWRELRRLTVRQLGDKVGCTDSYISHLEKEARSPSLDTCMVLAQVLELAPTEQQEFLEEVEATSHRRAEERLRVRAKERSNARGRWTALPVAQGRGPRAAVPGYEVMSGPVRQEDWEMGMEDLARELAADADLQAAYRDLKTVLGDPRMRETVLNTLRAFARAVHPGP